MVDSGPAPAPNSLVPVHSEKVEKMHIGRIAGCTRVLGKSQGYLGLPVRDTAVIDSASGNKTHAMETAWFPDPKELEALQNGAPVILRILGQGHPPVMIETGEVPDP